MINQEYHKGSFCLYTSIFCQEGYCAECEIYRQRPIVTKKKNINDGIKLPKPHKQNAKSQKAHKPILIH
jgi:hypothetical protein